MNGKYKEERESQNCSVEIIWCFHLTVTHCSFFHPLCSLGDPPFHQPQHRRCKSADREYACHPGLASQSCPSFTHSIVMQGGLSRGLKENSVWLYWTQVVQWHQILSVVCHYWAREAGFLFAELLSWLTKWKLAWEWSQCRKIKRKEVELGDIISALDPVGPWTFW